MEIPQVLGEIAGDYYQWSAANPNASRKDFPRYNETREIGERLFESGKKKAMVKAYEEAKKINPKQIWIVSKIWNRIGNPDSGEIDDVWMD